MKNPMLYILIHHKWDWGWKVLTNTSSYAIEETNYSLYTEGQPMQDLLHLSLTGKDVDS